MRFSTASASLLAFLSASSAFAYLESLVCQSATNGSRFEVSYDRWSSQTRYTLNSALTSIIESQLGTRIAQEGFASANLYPQNLRFSNEHSRSGSVLTAVSDSGGVKLFAKDSSGAQGDYFFQPGECQYR